MKTSVMKIGAAVVVIAATAACHQSAPEADDTLSFRRIEIEQSYRLAGSGADYESGTDLSFGCKAELVMPMEAYGKDLATLRDSIVSIAVDSTGTDYAAVLAGALPDMARESGYTLADTVLPDSVVRAEPNFLSRYDSFFSVEGDVETLTPKIMSYAVTTSFYLGGAHGMYSTRYLNYDLAENTLLTLDSLFTPDGLTALPGIIREAATRMRATIGPTDIKAVPAGGNFYLTPDGTIVFAYPPYEVASYAQGEIQIPVQGYLLAEYLSPTGNRILL